MASPLVAGIAGLVKAKYPNYSPEQIGEKVRVGCDDIYALNPLYRYQLGKGRVNAWRSLQDSINTSARMLSFELLDNPPLGNGNGTLEPNETAEIKVSFKNILAQTNNLTITLTTTTSGISIVNGTFNAGAKSTGESFNNFSNPFRIQAASNLGYDVQVRLILNFTDGNYSDWQVFTFVANPSYVVSNNNNISITIGSRGNIAFNDYPTNSQGRGFRYKTSGNLLFEGALITGISATKISDVARNASGNQQSNDFMIVSPIKLYQPGSIADMQCVSVFNDDGAGANKIGIKVILNSYSYSDAQNSDYVILHYKFINTTSSTISNFYAGLFFDWDLIDGSGDGDIALWDSNYKMGYVYNQPATTPYYVGASLLSHTNVNFRAINNAGGDGGWGIYDGFTDAEKWQAISGGLTKTQAGAGDVSFVIAGGPYTINAGDTLNVAFALLAADNLTLLRNYLNKAKQKWNLILTDVEENQNEKFSYQLYQNYPNPFNPKTTISFSIPTKDHVTLKIFDALGNEVTTLIDKELDAGKHSIDFDGKNLSSGIYFYQIQYQGYKLLRKMVLLK
jgi:hypothetical protein